MSSLSYLRDLTEGHILTGDQVFDAIVEASEISSSIRYENAIALEISIRLLDASEKGQVPFGSHDAIAHLAEECGLFPYLAEAKFSSLRTAAKEAFAVNLDRKVFLHAKQMEVLSHLLSGENVALSAPTSFGKSLILDAYISERKPHSVLVIVPTIALIDETRRRLERTFGAYYQVVSQKSDQTSERPVIFVLTQERFLARDDVGQIDFVFVDEFYKLDPHRDDQRSSTLNVALYRALKVTKQFFLAGPNVAFIDVGPVWKERIVFIRSRYQTVTVNTIDRSEVAAKFRQFVDDLKSVRGEQCLVYTKSPPAMRRLARELIINEFSEASDICVEVSEWIRANYHKGWIVGELCGHGIGMHHGKIPRSLSQFFVEMFNNEEMPVLMCTSTLIEGVNTSAENVFIYDREINTQPFDFFSFSNIRGRVGRMMQHFVGRVFLYNSPPPEKDLGVDVPVLSDPDNADDFVLMNYDPVDLKPEGLKRQLSLPLVFDLTMDTLKQYGHFSPEALAEVKQEISHLLGRRRGLLEWSGLPDYSQKVVIAQLIRPLLKARGDRTTRLSAKQMAWAWDKLFKERVLSDFLLWFQETFSPEKEQEGIERAFEFLSACEFNHATAVAAVNALVLEVDQALKANYSLFSHELEAWFRPSWVKEVDEMGVPVPLSERLMPLLGKPSNYIEALSKMSQLSSEQMAQLSSIDRRMIKRATASVALRGKLA